MEKFGTLLIIPIIVGPIIFLVGLIFFLFPPKKINNLYGYRTSSSIENQESWDFAQRYSSKELMKWGAVYTACSCIGLFINIGESVATGIAIFLLFSILAVAIYRVEKAIKNYVNTENNEK